jgi:hypothetical protein
MAGFLERYVTPMTRVLRAASTTSSVMAQAVDFEDAPDLHEQSVQQPEVASGDPRDRGDRLGIGEIGVVERQAKPAPMAGKHEGELVALKRSVVMGKADATVELRIARQAFFHARHADQDDASSRAIEDVAHELDRGRRQPLGLVDDQHLDVGVGVEGARYVVSADVLLDAGANPRDARAQSVAQVPQRARDGGRVDTVRERDSAACTGA